jgi:23S rRNA pseudouridine1911/1915/1917 synthase
MRRFTFADHSEGRRPHKPPAAPPTPWLAERLPPAMLGISMGPSLDVILETPTLLAVNKPADLVCHPTKGDAWSSLISRARMHCGEGFIPRLVNRLDRETSGLVLLAKNTDAAGQLGRMWELGRVQKTYLAVVHGHPSEDSGQIDAPLGKDEASVVAIKDCVRPDGRQAATGYAVLRRFRRNERRFALLRVLPRTGRKHQIRIHLAHHGHPIVGDKLYGDDPEHYLALVENRLDTTRLAALLTGNHLLHAAALEFEWNGAGFQLQAAPGQEFMEFIGLDPMPSVSGGEIPLGGPESIPSMTPNA